MANYTPYLDLKKPLGSEYYNVADQNGNMDKIDTSIQGLGNGLGIIAKGNTHAAITSGEYVYVHGHGTLAEGLYKATANIAANGTLTSSNLAALPKGVGGDVAALNSNKANKPIVIEVTGTTTSSGALLIPTVVVIGTFLSVWGANNAYFIYRRDNAYFMVRDTNLNVVSETEITIKIAYIPA